MIHELKETILSFGYDRSIMAKHEGERLSFPNEFFEAAQTVIGWWCWIKDNHIKKYATK